MKLPQLPILTRKREVESGNVVLHPLMARGWMHDPTTAEAMSRCLRSDRHSHSGFNAEHEVVQLHAHTADGPCGFLGGGVVEVTY